MLAAVCVFAITSFADGIMLKQNPGKSTCGNATGSAWNILEEGFLSIGGEGHYHCSDPSGGYCSRLAALGDLSLDDLKLPKNSNVLFYGHSYLLEVYDNFLLANSRFETKAESFSWENWEAGPAQVGVFPGCSAHGKGYSKFEEKNLTTSMYHGRHRYDSLNTSVFTVLNYGPLQHTTCMAELDRFLQEFNFDTILFMRPHGDEWIDRAALKAAGLPAESKPVDLATMKATGTVLNTANLSAKFKMFSQYTVYVAPWRRHISDETPETDAMLHADSMVDLKDYVFANGADLCSDPDCNTDQFHQCQPGTVTLSARALSSLLRGRPRASE